MNEKIEKLKADIAKLEEMMEKDHFGGLLDKAKSDKNYKRIKKLRKELKKLEEE
jgi:hypothetical protein